MHKSVASLSESLLSLSQRRNEFLLNLFVGVRLKLHWIISDLFLNPSPNSFVFIPLCLIENGKSFSSLGPNFSLPLHSFLSLLAQPDLALAQPAAPAHLPPFLPCEATRPSRPARTPPPPPGPWPKPPSGPAPSHAAQAEAQAAPLALSRARQGPAGHLGPAEPRPSPALGRAPWFQTPPPLRIGRPRLAPGRPCRPRDPRRVSHSRHGRRGWSQHPKP